VAATQCPTSTNLVNAVSGAARAISLSAPGDPLITAPVSRLHHTALN
jgi:hypothetical protein